MTSGQALPSEKARALNDPLQEGLLLLSPAAGPLGFKEAQEDQADR
jgi:hypothetical protein